MAEIIASSAEMCETINIVNADAPGGYIRINKADFDPKTQAEFKGDPDAVSTEPKTADEMNVKELKAALDAQKIEYSAKASKDELVALLKSA
jgi:hypothetical protein